MKRGPTIGIGVGIGVIVVAIIAISGIGVIDDNSTNGDQSDIENTNDLGATVEGKNFRITLEDGIGAGDRP